MKENIYMIYIDIPSRGHFFALFNFSYINKIKIIFWKKIRFAVLLDLHAFRCFKLFHNFWKMSISLCKSMCFLVSVTRK